MENLDQDETAPTSGNISSNTEELMSASMKRTSEWIFSQEIQSDVTVFVGGASFPLHKFPLVSKCGFIRKMVSTSRDAGLSIIEIPELPGGAEAFELAAKFCYGMNFEISTQNIAMLRCAAEYLEMTEDYAVQNLVGRTESYLIEVALQSISTAVSVLHSSETLLPMAEKVKVVSRCIDAIAYIVCKENQFCVSGMAESSGNGVMSSILSHQNTLLDWWAEDLTVLRIDIFQRVLFAIMARGFKQYALGPVLMLYTQKSLRGLEAFGKGKKNIEAHQELEKRVVLETIVSLLPREKNALPISFLSMLLRSAIYLETTVSCRLHLEKRMASQLAQAVLDDLLIPSYSFTGDSLFDVDTVQRIMMNHIEYEMEENHLRHSPDDEYVSPSKTDFEHVGNLMEDYLSEIASDRNLPVSKFISLGELIPEQSRATEDGIYRAIDIYLKAHPSLSDTEKKKVSSLMDCQKLSKEACAHAAQNDRLPVQTVAQVLYYEQQRLQDVMSFSNHTIPDSPPRSSKVTTINPTNLHPLPDQLSNLKRENDDLKIELLKMKMRVKEIEKSSTSSPISSTMSSCDKPPLPRKTLMSSVSKRLQQLYPFVRADGLTSPNAKDIRKHPRDRRHSIS